MSQTHKGADDTPMLSVVPATVRSFLDRGTDVLYIVYANSSPETRLYVQADKILEFRLDRDLD